MIRRISLAGDHYAMGFQHGQQVMDLRQYILDAVENRLEILTKLELKFRPFLDELTVSWEQDARSTLAMMRGIADALGLEWEKFFRYTVSTYLMDQARQPSDNTQGCSVWAVRNKADNSHMPLLVKNRDYWVDHRELQCFAHAHPKSGYRYAYLTSAGSPGVFSSGMNEVGLAVADTHVVSLDIGTGLPRYTVMMEILEQHECVETALEYLLSIRHTGNGTIVLADASGAIAVVETSYSIQNVIYPQKGFLISTNHFNSPRLNDLWMERRRRKALNGNSLARYAHIRRNLRIAHSDVDLDWAKGLMSSHGSVLSSICRHPEDNPRYVTISSAIYQPRSGKIYLADGMPCQTPYEQLSVVSEA